MRLAVLSLLLVVAGCVSWSDPTGGLESPTPTPTATPSPTPLELLPAGTISGSTMFGFGDTLVATSSALLVPASAEGFGYVGTVYLYDFSGNALGSFGNPAPFANPPTYVGFGRSVARGPSPGTFASASVLGRADILSFDGTLETTLLDVSDSFPRLSTTGTSLLVAFVDSSNGGVAEAGRIDVYGPGYVFDHTILRSTPLAGERLAERLVSRDGIAYASVGLESGAGQVVAFEIESGVEVAVFSAPSGWEHFGDAIAVGEGRVAISARSTTGNIFDGAVALFELDGTRLDTLHPSGTPDGAAFGRALGFCAADLVVGANGVIADAGVQVFDTTGHRIALARAPLGNDTSFGRSITGGLGSSFAAGTDGTVYLFDCP